MVEIYQKKYNEKRGKLSVGKPLLSIDQRASSIVVPGRKGRKITVAFEDTLKALPNESFAQLVQDGIDSIDKIIEKCSNDVSVHETSENAATAPSINNSFPIDYDFSKVSANVEPSVSDSISVFWPFNDHLFPGTIHSEEEYGRLNLHYDDSDRVTLYVSNEVWKFNEPISANYSSTKTELKVTSTDKSVQSSMLEHFFNKQLLRHHAQGFGQYMLVNAYKTEEETFLKTFRPVPHSEVPTSSHTLYKVKTSDDGSL